MTGARIKFDNMVVATFVFNIDDVVTIVTEQNEKRYTIETMSFDRKKGNYYSLIDEDGNTKEAAEVFLMRVE